jgi:large subunit ribosomal protein L15
MKLHELQPPAGARTPRTRVGRGIAAGKGKTAGRGTKGQKARSGGSIPPWFEGGQTPLHMRIPKLRGFKNRFKVEYEVVNVGAIAAAAERGAFEAGEHAERGGSKAAKAAPTTVNQDILRAVGLVRTLNKPLKILGAGELNTPLFVVADAFTRSAAAKIEAAGGTVSVLEIPVATRPALGVAEEGGARPARQPRTAAGRAAAGREAEARDVRIADDAERAELAAASAQAAAERSVKQTRAPKAKPAPAHDADAERETPAAETASTAATAESESDRPAQSDRPDASAGPDAEAGEPA